MENLEARTGPDEEAGEATEAGVGMTRNAARIVFGVVSVTFLLYLAFGTVEARIWRFGRLYFEDRHIRDVWGYLGDHLPDMPGQGVITALFWISLGVMVSGVILGLWLFLGTDDDDPAREAITTLPEQTAHDA